MREERKDFNAVSHNLMRETLYERKNICILFGEWGKITFNRITLVVFVLTRPPKKPFSRTKWNKLVKLCHY